MNYSDQTAKLPKANLDSRTTLIKRSLHKPSNTHLLFGVIRILNEMEHTQVNIVGTIRTGMLFPTQTTYQALAYAFPNVRIEEFHPYFPDVAGDIKLKCRDLIEDLIFDFNCRLEAFLLSHPEIRQENKEFLRSNKFFTEVTSYIKSNLLYRRGKTLKPSSPIQKLLAKHTAKVKLNRTSSGKFISQKELF